MQKRMAQASTYFTSFISDPFPGVPLLPGSGSYPRLFGRAESFFERDSEGMLQTFRDCKEVMDRTGKSRCYFWIGPILTLVLADPKEIENFKVSFEGHLDTDVKMLSMFLGKAFLNLEHNEWKVERKILKSSVDQSVSSIREIDAISKKHLDLYSSKTEVDFKRLFLGYALDVVTNFFIGFKNSDLASINSLIDLLKDLTAVIFQFRSVIKFMLPAAMRQRVFSNENNDLDAIRAEFEKRLTDLYSSSDNPPKYLRELYDHVKGLQQATDEEVGEIDFKKVFGRFLFIIAAASATTAATLQFTAILLHNNPGALAKLREEFRTSGITQDGLDSLTLDQINRLPYLDAIVKESQRLFPPTPLYLPRETEKSFKLGDLTIPVGSLVMPVPYIWQNQEKHYPEPGKFNPDRFLNPETKPPVPFSVGTRTCPGRKLALAEIKVMLIRLCLLYNFDLKNASYGNAHLIELTMSTGAVTPKKDVIGTFWKRDSERPLDRLLPDSNQEDSLIEKPTLTGST